MASIPRKNELLQKPSQANPTRISQKSNAKFATKFPSLCEGAKESNQAIQCSQKSSWNLHAGQEKQSRSPSGIYRSQCDMGPMSLQYKTARNRASPRTATRPSPGISRAPSSKKQSPAKQHIGRETKNVATELSRCSIGDSSTINTSFIDESWSALNSMPGSLIDEEPMPLIPPDLPYAFDETEQSVNEDPHLIFQGSETSPFLEFGLKDCASVAKTETIPVMQSGWAVSRGEVTQVSVAALFEEPLFSFDLSAENISEEDLTTLEAWNVDPITIGLPTPDPPLSLTSTHLPTSGAEPGFSCLAKRLLVDKIPKTAAISQTVSSPSRKGRGSCTSRDDGTCIVETRLADRSPVPLDLGRSLECENLVARGIGVGHSKDDSLFCDRGGELILNLEAFGSNGGCMDSLERFLKEGEHSECDRLSDWANEDVCILTKTTEGLSERSTSVPCEGVEEIDSALSSASENQDKFLPEHGCLDFCKVFPINQDDETLGWSLDTINDSDAKTEDLNPLDLTSWLIERVAEPRDTLQRHFFETEPRFDSGRSKCSLPSSQKNSLKHSAGTGTSGQVTSTKKYNVGKDIKKDAPRTISAPQTRISKSAQLTEQRHGTGKVSRAKISGSSQLLGDRKSLESYQEPNDGLGKKTYSGSQKVSALKVCTGSRKASFPSGGGLCMPTTSEYFSSDPLQQRPADALDGSRWVVIGKVPDAYQHHQENGQILQNTQEVEPEKEREKTLAMNSTILVEGMQKDLSCILEQSNSGTRLENNEVTRGSSATLSGSLSGCPMELQSENYEYLMEELSRKTGHIAFSDLEGVRRRSSNSASNGGNGVELGVITDMMGDGTDAGMNLNDCMNCSHSGHVLRSMVSYLNFKKRDEMSSDCIENLIGMGEFDGKEGIDDCLEKIQTSVPGTCLADKNLCREAGHGLFPQISLTSIEKCPTKLVSMTHNDDNDLSIICHLPHDVCGMGLNVYASSADVDGSCILEGSAAASNVTELSASCLNAIPENCSSHESCVSENASCLDSYPVNSGEISLEGCPSSCSSSFQVALQEFGRAVEQLTESKLKEETAVSSLGPLQKASTIRGQDLEELVVTDFHNSSTMLPVVSEQRERIFRGQACWERGTRNDSALNGSDGNVFEGFTSVDLISASDCKQQDGLWSTESQMHPFDGAPLKLFCSTDICSSEVVVNEVVGRHSLSGKAVRSLSFNEGDNIGVQIVSSRASLPCLKKGSSISRSLSLPLAGSHHASCLSDKAKHDPSHQTKARVHIQQGDSKVEKCQNMCCPARQQQLNIVSDSLEAYSDHSLFQKDPTELDLVNSTLCMAGNRKPEKKEGIEKQINCTTSESDSVSLVLTMEEGCQMEDASSTGLKSDFMAIDHILNHGISDFGFLEEDEIAKRCVPVDGRLIDGLGTCGKDDEYALKTDGMSLLTTECRLLEEEILELTVVDDPLPSSERYQQKCMHSVPKIDVLSVQSSLDGIADLVDSLDHSSDHIDEMENDKSWCAQGDVQVDMHIQDEFSRENSDREDNVPGVHLSEINRGQKDSGDWKNFNASSLSIYKNPLWSEELGLNFVKVRRSWQDKEVLDLPNVMKCPEGFLDFNHYVDSSIHDSEDDAWNMVGVEFDGGKLDCTPHSLLHLGKLSSQEDRSLKIPETLICSELNSENYLSKPFWSGEMNANGPGMLDVSLDKPDATSVLLSQAESSNMNGLEFKRESDCVSREEYCDCNIIGHFLRNEDKQTDNLVAVGCSPVEEGNDFVLSEDSVSNVKALENEGLIDVAQTTKFGSEFEEKNSFNSGKEFHQQCSFSVPSISNLIRNLSGSDKFLERNEAFQCIFQKMPSHADVQPDMDEVNSFDHVGKEETGCFSLLTYGEKEGGICSSREQGISNDKMVNFESIDKHSGSSLTTASSSTVAGTVVLNISAETQCSSCRESGCHDSKIFSQCQACSGDEDYNELLSFSRLPMAIEQESHVQCGTKSNGNTDGSCFSTSSGINACESCILNLEPETDRLELEECPGLEACTVENAAGTILAEKSVRTTNESCLHCCCAIHFNQDLSMRLPKMQTFEDRHFSTDGNQKVKNYNAAGASGLTCNKLSPVDTSLAGEVEDVKQVTYTPCNSKSACQEEVNITSSFLDSERDLGPPVVCSMFCNAEGVYGYKKWDFSPQPIPHKADDDHIGASQIEKKVEALDAEIYMFKQEYKKLQKLVKENKEIAKWLAREKATWELQKSHELQIFISHEEKAKQLRKERFILERQSSPLLQLSHQKLRMELEELKAKLLQVTEDHLKEDCSWHLTAHRFEQVIAILLGQIQALQKVKEVERQQLSLDWDLEDKCFSFQSSNRPLKYAVKDVTSEGRSEKLLRENYDELTINRTNCKWSNTNDESKVTKKVAKIGVNTVLPKETKRSAWKAKGRELDRSFNLAVKKVPSMLSKKV